MQFGFARYRQLGKRSATRDLRCIHTFQYLSKCSGVLLRMRNLRRQRGHERSFSLGSALRFKRVKKICHGLASYFMLLNIGHYDFNSSLHRFYAG